MAICNIPIKCISEKLCKDCAYMELDISRMTMWSEDSNVSNVNEIYCTKYKQCTAMLNHLKLINKEPDPLTEKVKDILREEQTK